MTMDMPEKTLGSAVCNPYRSPGSQGKETRMDLEADVFTGTECSADTSEHETN
jgi:hypothetical protein